MHLWKDFVRYASLSMLGMLGLSCYILADTFFVAQGVGETGLAALNLALPAYNLMNGAALMLGRTMAASPPLTLSAHRRTWPPTS